VSYILCCEPAIYPNVISQYRSATTTLFHFDVIGSTDSLTNAIGAITDGYVYEAFGIVTQSHGTTINPFRFIGRKGFYYEPQLTKYFGSVYDPRLSTFLERRMSGSVATSIGPYTIVAPPSSIFALTTADFIELAAGARAKPKPSPPGTMPPAPPIGLCTVALCCREAVGPYCHCFVLTTNSNRQQVFYNCTQKGPFTSSCPIGTLAGRSGGYGDPDEDFVNPTVCQALGNFPCGSIQACLQLAIDFVTRLGLCYPCSPTGFNSNTCAAAMLRGCLPANIVPVTPKLPSSCSSAPGYGRGRGIPVAPIAPHGSPQPDGTRWQANNRLSAL
jgi:hypothetical protein